MANFQFGQQNVGSNWDVPSWYVQSMGQSPMAASIAGIGNSIAAFASGYQAARQAERGYGLDERRVKAQEKQIEQQGSYYESLNKQRQQAGNEDQVIGNWLSGVGDEVSRYNEWVKAGRPSANSQSLQNTSAMVPANVLQNAPFPQDGLTPATQRTNLGVPYANPYFDLPAGQGQYPVNPSGLMGY